MGVVNVVDGNGQEGRRSMPDDNISGRQVAAARALAGVSRNELASAAKISAAVLGEIEAGGAAWVRPPEIVHALRVEKH